ncbi:hypothetical protein GXW78_24470 [Roseomonas terrae]|jgi:hypothetical protein|uniref:Uncharacterized protein n=1 Tax=Neoroseomonas terrae TaxID=424799 RepID=A0ABS5EP65_9PROT|nr:hypothetical protein [Neoroseomonas terrae]MBR0652834.1 hypothetical protein [Neoroseomonas terrae]
MRATIILACLLLAVPASAQQPREVRYFGEIYIRAARLVTLAPLCGLRDEAWAQRLAQGVSATRHGVLPEGQQEGLASAAFAVTAGTRLYETFGRTVCDPAADTIMLWRDADELARADAGAEPPLPTLPEAVTLLAWQAFIAQMAVRCDMEDRRWEGAAMSGIRRAIAMQPGLAADEGDRRRMARHMVAMARAMANLVHGTHGAKTCTPIRGNPALAQAEATATQWRRLCTARRPDPTCPLGQPE